jgi:hypothetical protein
MQTKTVPMRSVTKAWPARLIAAVTALALVVACVVGAYAHAAGHALPGAEQATAAVEAADHAGHHKHVSEPGTSKPGHVGNGHDCDGTGHAPLNGCDTICHGGQAILVASVLVPHPVPDAPLIQSAAALHGAEPAGLDRPPKPFRPA